MQFYLNGYRTGDPLIRDAHPSVEQRLGGLPGQVDVLIIGAGPAGLVLAAQLAEFPEIKTVVIDRKDGPLKIGQADGLACRTMEMLQAFGIANGLINEGYSVNEVAFWRPDPHEHTNIARSGRIPDVEDGLSEMPHVIVNQARLLDYLLGHMKRSAGRLEPLYGLQAGEIGIGTGADPEYPVTVTVRHLNEREPNGKESTIRAKYVVGCDGSRSSTRQAIGQQLVGDPTNQSWGVMDAFAVTDFPDIRVKCAIHSANQGNMLVIPREGGYMVRFYIELDNVRDREVLHNRNVNPAKLAEIANRILHPYTLEVKDVGWWTVYEVGQRLCDKFDDVPQAQIATRRPRVFIAGDACHTHSAKAGQGMNVSMNDTWNLGWKLGAVLRGTARPELLHTYSEERQAVARHLIDFDREFAKMFGTAPNNPSDPGAEGIDPAEFQQYFTRHGRFTAGVATRYSVSMLTARTRSQHLAEGFPVGMRFHSAPVVRWVDAKPMQLGHAAGADGAWRVYIFGDQHHPTEAESNLVKLCEFLGSAESPVTRHTPPGHERDSLIDVRAIFQQERLDLALEDMPAVLLPRKGRLGLVDYEKMFCADPTSGDIFDLRAIDRRAGCIVVVRPDQYVSHVLPLDAHTALADFFAAVLLEVA